ncbi:Serine/threonine-protein kinase PknA [Piscirickettsia salmonis]|uniref:non-specific serine/threonine protein kinase n=1 Tax=Piscirickettsia salmonis TaxID=1238 RepID=A0AAC8VFB8_PISSA|nr:serine/threonine-protein kinase [Piscirickettsia salmonis]AKP72865.1 hypothetical protein PSLF89_777 [Piscirickettsia salmonis LF-89 = ATCC VR-1361]ALB21484.1 kinase domain protein [Piscirickettsia salmonis]ALY01706.1 hypothetical protein AWE47_01495 [Piscirickettsia salmonis]AMA41222.1 hypothetical protein AWJ11_01505 [Piscirickettsia salmonis]AOS36411.1 hypothetical protein AVM72_14490 [Piscirickettsia salmonis]
MDETKTLLFDKKGGAVAQVEESEQSLIGLTLKERFTLMELIGVGGMGQVYKALDKHKEDVGESYPFVAIKVLNQGIQHMDKALLALQRETYKEQQLAHPNIVNVYDFDRDDDVVYKTMELVEGKSLKEWLLDHKVELVGESTKLHRRHFQSVLHIIIQAAKGLEHAHEHRIVHSDLKPGNIIVTPTEVVKLLDFGIARTIRPLQAGQDDVSIFDPVALAAFTPAYASYEMLCGEEPHPSDDIYALGCIFYELLTGKHPYNKCSALKALEDNLVIDKIIHIPDWLWLIIRDMLALKRKKRLASASKLLERLHKKDQKTHWFSLAKMSVFALCIIIIVMALSLFYLMRKNNALLALHHGQALNSANAAVTADPYDETAIVPSSTQTQTQTQTQTIAKITTETPKIKQQSVIKKKEPEKAQALKINQDKAQVKPAAKPSHVKVAAPVEKTSSVEKVVVKAQQIKRQQTNITQKTPKVNTPSVVHHALKSSKTSVILQEPICTSALAGFKSGAYCYLPLGKNNKITMRVIKQAGQIFALSEDTVTKNDYAKFCQASGLCAPISGDQPVTDLSFEQIEQYFSWLRNKTGLALQLPTNTKWQQALYTAMAQQSICDYYGTGPNLTTNQSIYHNRFNINYQLASYYEWVTMGQNHVLRGAFFQSAVKPYCRVMQVMPNQNNISQATFRVMLKSY